MLCINNKSDIWHWKFANLEEGQNYDIQEEKTVEMEFWKRKTRIKKVDIVKIDWKWFNKERFN